MTKAELLQEIYQAIGSEFFTDSAVLDKRCLELIQKFKGDAIADHEAKQWKPYPEHEPEFGEEYLFLTDNNYIFSSKWYGSIALPWATIIAFRELPTPYQPKEGGKR